MKLRDELAAAVALMDAAALAFAKVSAKVQHLLSVAEGDDTVESASPSPSPSPPAPATAPPAPPSLVLVPPQIQPEWPIVFGVMATCWLNEDDDKTGETAKQPAYPWAPRNHDGIGKTLLGCAVPFAVEQGDGVDVRLSGTAHWTFIPVTEKGPHHTDDDYLKRGARPRAESEPGNHAGIDITPPGWALLWGKTAEQEWAGEPSGLVELRWHPRAATAPLTPFGLRDAALARARAYVGATMTYELGKEPPGFFSDCSGFVNYCNGIDRDTTGENTDAMVADANGPHRYYRTVVGPAQPGDDYVYPSPGAGHYGHTGVISEVDAVGAPTKVIHCSSGNPAGHAVQETDPGVFTRHGAIIVRAVAFGD